jgi:hypothetical protein
MVEIMKSDDDDGTDITALIEYFSDAFQDAADGNWQEWHNGDQRDALIKRAEMNDFMRDVIQLLSLEDLQSLACTEHACAGARSMFNYKSALDLAMKPDDIICQIRKASEAQFFTAERLNEILRALNEEVLPVDQCKRGERLKLILLHMYQSKHTLGVSGFEVDREDALDKAKMQENGRWFEKIFSRLLFAWGGSVMGVTLLDYSADLRLKSHFIWIWPSVGCALWQVWGRLKPDKDKPFADLVQ